MGYAFMEGECSVMFIFPFIFLSFLLFYFILLCVCASIYNILLLFLLFFACDLLEFQCRSDVEKCYSKLFFPITRKRKEMRVDGQSKQTHTDTYTEKGTCIDTRLVDMQVPLRDTWTNYCTKKNVDTANAFWHVP